MLGSLSIFYFKFVTLFGEGHVAAGFFGIVYAFSSRDKAYYLLFVHTVAGIANQELKIMYHDPRPYMSSDDVLALGCSKSFGNPSGHSSLTSCFYTTLFLMIFHDPKHSVYTNRGVKYWLSIGLLAFVIFNVGLSRVVLGVHSIN